MVTILVQDHLCYRPFLVFHERNRGIDGAHLEIDFTLGNQTEPRLTGRLGGKTLAFFTNRDYEVGVQFVLTDVALEDLWSNADIGDLRRQRHSGKNRAEGPMQ